MPLTIQDATIIPYVRGTPPADAASLNLYLTQELTRLERTINNLTLLAPQVAISEPRIKLRGMYRYNKSPWNPLGTGDGWVHYTGSAWTAV